MPSAINGRMSLYADGAGERRGLAIERRCPAVAPHMSAAPASAIRPQPPASIELSCRATGSHRAALDVSG